MLLLRGCPSSTGVFSYPFSIALVTIILELMILALKNGMSSRSHKSLLAEVEKYPEVIRDKSQHSPIILHDC